MANVNRVFIAGGGTGGHIYPGLAIAKALKEQDASIEVEFVGTENGLEAKIIPKENYPLHFIPVGKLNKNVSIFTRIETLLKMPFSLLRAWALIRYRQPRVVIGVGGYASAPVVLIASLMGRKTLVWEPNAFPGLANRILSRFVNYCLVVFAEAGKYLKNKDVIQVPMPLRAEIEKPAISGKKDGRFNILVFGGSQGARAINNCLAEAVKNVDWRANINIVHQTGSADFERIKASYEKLPGYGSTLQVFEYLHDMPQRYANADLIVSRSGTGTLSELAACGKPAILIPLPSAADDHQRINAEVLVSKGAARLLQQNELTPERLIREITTLMNAPQDLQQMSEKIKTFYEKGASQKIAKIILEQV